MLGAVSGADGTDDPRPTAVLCLVHLVWGPLGPGRLGRFLDAYRRHDAGAPHRLLIVFNGFGVQDDLSPWRRLLTGVEHDVLRLSAPVLDLDAYRQAVERLPAQRYCFANSYSEPLVDGWLGKLDVALTGPGVGLAGATGSWASTRSLMAHVLRLPSAYRGVLPEPRVAIEQFMAVEADRMGAAPAVGRRGAGATIAARLVTVAQALADTVPYERFPAYHIRTNAFAIARATLAGLALPSVHDKRAAHLLENGRRSITRQVQRNGLRTVVVDRAGAVYDHEQWHESRTFWQGNQEGLLVTDNQTRRYADADGERRTLLSRFAWGRKADPTLP